MIPDGFADLIAAPGDGQLLWIRDFQAARWNKPPLNSMGDVDPPVCL
jgi:hypothetical protein